jgi:hypothetical protein
MVYFSLLEYTVEVEVGVVVEMYMNTQKSFAFLAEEALAALLSSFTPASTYVPFSRGSLNLLMTSPGEVRWPSILKYVFL